jgi:hypothetical protein
MDMLGHGNVAEDVKVVTKPHGFKRTFEDRAGAWFSEVGLPSVTTECHEVCVSGSLITNQSQRHYGILCHTKGVECGLLTNGFYSLFGTHISKSRCGAPAVVGCSDIPAANSQVSKARPRAPSFVI